MPTEDGLPSVGDVITSQKFVFGKKDESGKFIKIVNTVDCTKLFVSLQQGDTFIEKSIARGAHNIDAFDASRAQAEFLVIDAHWVDNPIVKGTDACASRWYISAQRLLHENGSKNLGDERIAFFLCGLSDENVLAPNDIKIVRTTHMPVLQSTKRKKSS
ncbi:MAG: hypothetical protein G01um101448_454 [Parcubacteria group bacterium Gr01-1014_48]|nr:MAG: hypothetical protein Greene041614_276 [Parcubacteria group bacterium Greene0416_14]TSC73906.1 MAG: hypothetical protein G01um101448_454 [Parcubacteria group bacterium Gr01-1014_48]TSD00307.1 MAG: hypothetical protein Greene101415_898 [Parcubacteria group bacterium Greene1014_15]TSD06986.1 MAG: hypothetical protein Greene07144_1041 [Parcubacteria group bacterium Greene0714_4]